MAYIGKGLDNGVRNQFIFAATQGQTAFSGADSDGKTLAISDILYTDCFQNGVKLEPTTDYTVTLTSLTLVNAASLNDVVDIVSFDIFAVPDTVPASTGGTFTGAITATSFAGSGASLTGLTSSQMPAGSVLQVVTATTTTSVTSTSTTYIDSGLTANITPSSTSSRIMIMVTHPTNVYAADAVTMGLKLLRGSTNVWENAAWRYVGVQNNVNIITTQSMHYVDSPSSTSALTYKTQFARLVAAGSPTVATLQPSSAIAIITLMEIGG